MKLNRQEKEIVRKKFCAYCIKVLHGEALNYLDELKRQREREVSFSELLQKDLDACIYMTIMNWQRNSRCWVNRFLFVMNGLVKH